MLTSRSVQPSLRLISSSASLISSAKPILFLFIKRVYQIAPLMIWSRSWFAAFEFALWALAADVVALACRRRDPISSVSTTSPLVYEMSGVSAMASTRLIRRRVALPLASRPALRFATLRLAFSALARSCSVVLVCFCTMSACCLAVLLLCCEVFVFIKVCFACCNDEPLSVHVCVLKVGRVRQSRGVRLTRIGRWVYRCGMRS